MENDIPDVEKRTLDEIETEVFGRAIMPHARQWFLHTLAEHGWEHSFDEKPKDHEFLSYPEVCTSFADHLNESHPELDAVVLFDDGILPGSKGHQAGEFVREILDKILPSK